MHSDTELAVPFLDLVAQHQPLERELTEVFRAALRSASFIGGTEVERFEREFADYCGAEHCIGVASGTDALTLALMAAGVGPGDAVVTVSHTFAATVEAIHHAGAVAELVDIDERTCLMTAAALDEYLAECTVDGPTGRPRGQSSGRPIKVVVPVHLYGQVADMDAIARVAAARGVTIVEDACQAHGARSASAKAGWRRAGSFGRAAAFSFYPSKNLGACGDAGAVTTSDSELAATIRLLRDHGQSRKYVHERPGYNSRLDAIQAAVLRVKLPHLDVWNAGRRAAAGIYDAGLQAIPGIVLPVERTGSESVYHLYVVAADRRDELAAALQSRGIQTGLHYPIPVHHQRGFVSSHDLRLPVTERVASRVLSLPMYPTLRVDQQQHVIDAIKSFVDAPPAKQPGLHSVVYSGAAQGRPHQ